MTDISDHDLLIEIHSDIKAIKENYVTQEQFFPVKALAFGGVSIALGGTLITILWRTMTMHFS